MSDSIEVNIDNDNYTLWDRFLYGGLGYSMIALPTNIFRIIGTVLFPPLGVIMQYITTSFPYLDIVKIIENIDEIIYVAILTTFFYVPGLIYSLSLIKTSPDPQQSVL